MSSPETETNLPAAICQAIAGIPKSLVPASLKALDRLVGAAIDIPVAWLDQKKTQIESQTNSYRTVEQAIAKAVASQAECDPDTVAHAFEVLVRKSYRKQLNLEAVAIAMLEDLSENAARTDRIVHDTPESEIDEDWLNVFERYSQDASTERMQKLWGRVLSGEIRKPGKYSMRTLRFLSEFSQGDALMFADYCDSTFGDIAPAKLVKPDDLKDLRGLIHLEAAGLIQGASGLGLSNNVTFDAEGNGFMGEGNLVLVFKGKPGKTITNSACVLTPLGQELLSLLPGRDARSAARNVAFAMKTPEVESAYLANVVAPSQQLMIMEVLWQENTNTEQSA